MTPQDHFWRGLLIGIFLSGLFWVVLGYLIAVSY